MIDLNLADIAQEKLVAALEALLKRADTSAPFSLRTGADEIIDAAKRASVTDVNFAETLTTALGLVVRQQRKAVVDGSADEAVAAISVMSRAAFVVTELKLELSSDDLVAALIDVLPVAQQSSELDGPLLLILRAIGRLKDGYTLRLFWSSLLTYPNRGIRTVAAQNLARSAVGEAVENLELFLDKDINGPLLAHTILRQAGSLDALASISARYPKTRPLLEGLLREAGETEAADALSSQRAVVVSLLSRISLPQRAQNHVATILKERRPAAGRLLIGSMG